MKYVALLLLLMTAGVHAEERKPPVVATEEAADLNMNDIRKFLRRYYDKKAAFEAERGQQKGKSDEPRKPQR